MNNYSAKIKIKNLLSYIIECKKGKKKFLKIKKEKKEKREEEE